MTPVERRILIKVSTMYYLEHMKQTEIAKRLGVERTTVSKHLKRALEQGIVTITVANENFEDIESAMEKRFGLKECFIVPRSLDLLAVKQSMGRAGLQLLRRIVSDKQIIGLAWGTSIRELTRHAQNSKVPQIDSDFVPLDGGPENIDSELHVNTLCYELARAFGGRCHYIYAPVITRTAEIRNAIVQDANYEKISEFWKKLDIAIVGIGAPVKSSNLVWMGEFGRQAIESLSRTGTVGEICSVFYDKNGREVKTDFSDRIIGVDLDTLRNLNYSIGMAASREKVPAIMGACKGQAINVLITDEQTAKIMLNEWNFFALPCDNILESNIFCCEIVARKFVCRKSDRFYLRVYAWKQTGIHDCKISDDRTRMRKIPCRNEGKREFHHVFYGLPRNDIPQSNTCCFAVSRPRIRARRPRR